MTWFGYPKRILADRGLHALNNRGTSTVLTQVPKPIPALSYAEDRFFDEVALWYDAVLPILTRHPRLLMVQVDNEMAFFFGVNAWCADYSPASVANFRRFLGDVVRRSEQAPGCSARGAPSPRAPRTRPGWASSNTHTPA